VTNRITLDAVDVLLVEDDAGDVLLTKEAFAYHRVHDTLHVVGDGEPAIEFLRRTGDYTDVPRPGLILLDLNLPRRTGLEVLADLKSDQDLHSIPVVVLTTSQAKEDIVRSYALHANAYISKPVDFQRFSEAVRQINDFFLTLAELPNLFRACLTAGPPAPDGAIAPCLPSAIRPFASGPRTNRRYRR
jgi:CheY-like chemotaxis protein